MANSLKLLVCENFSKEARLVLAGAEFADVELIVYPARCGRPPITLAEVVELAKTSIKASSVQLFGSCCAGDLRKDPESAQCCQVNYLQQCFHLICSKSMIDELLKEGAYLLTPEWLASWPEKIKQMGFDRAMARDFFGQSVKSLVLLDTGINKDSSKQLLEFAEFVGIASRIIPVDLDFLQLKLANVIEIWRRQEIQNCLDLSLRRVADYAMAMDFLGKLASLEIDKDPVATLKELFTMLFAPGIIVFIPFSGQVADELASTTDCCDLSPSQWESIRKTGFKLTDSKAGFLLSLHSRDSHFGLLRIDHVMFPAHLDHYLNLALTVAEVCGLAMHNSAIAQDLKAEITAKEKLIDELQKAFFEIRSLRGIIPICSYCKQIRNDAGAWDKLEDYLREHSDAEFTHGMCPKCYAIEMKKMDDEEGSG